MTLAELCEPLFQYLCQFNATSRSGVHYLYPEVRRNVDDLLERIRTTANSDPRLVGVYDKATEESLIFFVDHFFSESGIQPLANEWAQNRIAFGLNPPNYVGDEAFWNNLDAALADRSEAATQRLLMYYNCIGLGMTGVLAGEHDKLRRKMLEISQRLRQTIEPNTSSLLCADAYDNINDDQLIEPPVKAPVVIAVAGVGMLIVLLAAYVGSWNTVAGKLSRDLQGIPQAYPQTSTTSQEGR